MTQDLKKLQNRLKQVEKELDKCRTTVREDGWQTQRHAKKSRKWDFLAKEKMNLIQKIDDEIKKEEGITNSDLCHRNYHEYSALTWWNKLSLKDKAIKMIQCELLPKTIKIEHLKTNEICIIFEWHLSLQKNS